jgi:hypothetical protein
MFSLGPGLQYRGAAVLKSKTSEKKKGMCLFLPWAMRPIGMGGMGAHPRGSAMALRGRVSQPPPPSMPVLTPPLPSPKPDLPHRRREAKQRSRPARSSVASLLVITGRSAHYKTYGIATWSFLLNSQERAASWMRRPLFRQGLRSEIFRQRLQAGRGPAGRRKAAQGRGGGGGAVIFAQLLGGGGPQGQ